MGNYRWNLLPPAPAEYLAAASGFPPLLAQLMYNRGLTESSQLEPFLAGDERLSGDPFLLPDMERAVSRIYRALLCGERIAVYGDFDVDGISSTAVLVEGLSALGSQAIPYIPNRLTEGYGLRTAALESLYQQGVSLVVTVDCGITALAEVRRAKKLGLDIIITDHHIPLAEMPPALAVIDPKRSDSDYPFSELAGAGVALKLVEALFRGIGRGEIDGLFDLVALGTVADRMPLLGENRYLVKRGLGRLNASPRLGVREIMARSGLEVGGIDSDKISWTVAPRLNAAGRLAHAWTSYRLLVTDSPEEAQELSVWLEEKNDERQKLTTMAVARAREQVLSQEISPLLMACDSGYPVGIAGLVASRLSEEFYRPAVVARVGERMSSGSCRSIPEFNITLALSRCSHLLSHFGGHSRAAGFSLPTKNLPRLQQLLVEIATADLAGVDLRPRLDIDAELSLSRLSGNVFPAMQRLAPFGQGNAAPAFLSRGIEVLDCRTMGGDGEHLRLKLKQGGTVWDAVGFRLGNYRSEISSVLDVVYNLEVDSWGGAERLRLNILDFAPGQGRPSA